MLGHDGQVKTMQASIAGSLARAPTSRAPASKRLLLLLLGALAARLVLVHAGQLKRVRVIHALRGSQRSGRRRLLGGVLRKQNREQ